MWGQAPWTTDLSGEVRVIAASTKSVAQCPSNVISIYLHTVLMTPAFLLLCVSISIAALLLRGSQRMRNSAPTLGLWGQWSPDISVLSNGFYLRSAPSFLSTGQSQRCCMEGGRWDLWNMVQQKRKRISGVYQLWNSGSPPSLANTRELVWLTHSVLGTSLPC